MNSALVLQTLMEADPQFEQMCEVLYGPDFTFEEVYNDVFGVAKADTTSSTDKTLKRVGLAATLIGAGLGVKEINEGRHLMQATKPIKLGRLGQSAQKAGLLSKDPMKATQQVGRRKVGVSTAMFAGDLAATHGLAHSTKQQGVAKGLSLRPVKEIAAGIRQGWKGAEKIAQKTTTAPDAAKAATQTNRGIVAGRAARHPIQSTTEHPKAALATAGVGGAAVMRHRDNKAVAYDNLYKRDEPDFAAEGTFTKFDTDKRLAFGWASIVRKDGVDVVDRQGDYITPEDLEEAAYKYVLSSRVGGDMHRRVTSELGEDKPHHVADLVESFVVTPEKIAKMGLPPETPVGWWVGMKVHDDTAWQEIKKGGRTGFSIHGKGKRADHTLEF